MFYNVISVLKVG